MNGAAVIYQLLAADSAVTALVPDERIINGDLPQGIALPALEIAEISSVDQPIISPGAMRFTMDRIQVTVHARSKEELAAVLKVAKSAGDAKSPVVSGLENVIVRTDGQGPYFKNDAASIHLRSQDFRVSYNQLA